MAIAFITSRHWIGIIMDSRILNDWIALIIRILDGSILPFHEPEGQTMNGVDSRTVIGYGCENPHLIEEVNHLLCSLAVTVPEFGEFHFRYGKLTDTEVSREVLLLIMERFYCRQREKGIKGFHAVETLVVILEEIKLFSGQQDSILDIHIFHLYFFLW